MVLQADYRPGPAMTVLEQGALGLGRLPLGLLAVAAVIGCAGDLENADSYQESVVLQDGARTPNQPPTTVDNGDGESNDDDANDDDANDDDANDDDANDDDANDDDANDDDEVPAPELGDDEPEMCSVVELDGCPDVPTQIFATACGTERCHGSAEVAPLGYTDLGHSISDITTRLLDLPGSEGGRVCRDHLVIDTDNPEQSLLISKLTSTPPCGLTMPFGVFQVSDDDIDCITRWVLAVAGGDTTEVACNSL